MQFLLEIIQQLGTGVVNWWDSQSTADLAWHAFGFAAQGMFFSRWLVQWIISERAQKSIVPVVFWFLSLVGGFMMFIYVTHLGSPALMVGQAIGMIVYFRNIVLVKREQREAAIDMVKAVVE